MWWCRRVCLALGRRVEWLGGVSVWFGRGRKLSLNCVVPRSDAVIVDLLSFGERFY